MSQQAVMMSMIRFIHSLKLPTDLRDEIGSAEADFLDEISRILSDADLTVLQKEALEKLLHQWDSQLLEVADVLKPPQIIHRTN